MHIPLTTYLEPANPAMNTVNAADLLKLLGDRPSVSFAGHTHSTEHHYLGDAEGFPGTTPHHHHVLTAVSGSWWSGPLDHRGIACADSHDGTPNGFHILSIDGTKYTTRYVPAAEACGQADEDRHRGQAHEDDREVFRTLTMSTLLRSPITADQAGGAAVLVNVFDGGPKTVVTGVIDGGPALTMLRISPPGPLCPTGLWPLPQYDKAVGQGAAVFHIWTAKLPAALQPGTYALKVKAVDEYGREHRDSMVLEVI